MALPPVKSKNSYEPAKPPWSSLKSSLNQTKLAVENPAQYQTINGLITSAEDFQNLVNNQLSSILASLNNEDTLPASSLLGRSNRSAGPVQNIFLGEGLVMREDVLSLENVGDWDLVLTKINDQDVIDTSVLVPDTELWFNTFEFQVWYVSLLLLYAGNSVAADYKLDFVLPTVDGWYRYIAQTDAGGALLVSTGIQFATDTALNAALVLGTDAALTPRVLQLDMMVRCGADGSIQLAFANNAAGANTVSRTYAGSVLRAKLLAGTPIGNNDAGDPGGGSGPGGGADPPTVPFPNDLSVVSAYFAANPAQVANSCQTEAGGNGNWDLMNGIVAALQAVSPRYGFNGKRGDTGNPSWDVVNYYHGVMPPVFGSRNCYTVDIIAGHCGPDPQPAWINVTTPAAQCAWMPGPI